MLFISASHNVTAKCDILCPKTLFLTEKQLHPLHFFVVTCNVWPVPWRSHNPLRITKSPITGKSFINLILSSLVGVEESISTRQKPSVRLAVEKVSSSRLNTYITFFAKTGQNEDVSILPTDVIWLTSQLNLLDFPLKLEGLVFLFHQILENICKIIQASKRFLSRIVQLKMNLFTGVSNSE